MAKGTRMKQLEMQLDAMQMGLQQNLEQIEERMETLELGPRQTQEEMRTETTAVERNLSMFSKIPNASLPADFPPRPTSAPILSESRIQQHVPDPLEAEERSEFVPENSTRGTNANQYHTPMPRLDIPVFEANKPSWWI